MWCLSSILEKDPEMADKIGFAPYPVMMEDGTPMVLVAEDSGYSISADSEHIDEAKEFLSFLFSPENQKKYSESLGSPSAFTDVDAEWAPASVVEGVNSARRIRRQHRLHQRETRGLHRRRRRQNGPGPARRKIHRRGVRRGI